MPEKHTNQRLRVGIVGAGLNADYHLNFAKAYREAEIVGIADCDLSRAEERARAHAIPRAFASVRALLAEAAPDVVHVVTPPRTHCAVVRELLQAGRHVLVEKPMALDAREAETLYALAERQGVQLCPMHNHLFDPCMLRARALVDAGALGPIVNVESYYGLNTRIPAFRDYPRPNVLPWLYGLPGGVYQDFLPHPTYALLDYTGAVRSLTVKHRATGVLPRSLPDEIRILIEGERALGTITVSFAARPHLHFLRIHGTEAMVEVDFNNMTTVVHPVSSLPKAAQKLTYNLQDGWQRTRGTVGNAFRFVSGRLKPYHGMMNLIHAFYDSLRAQEPPPVSRAQALGVVRTMDAVFEQLRPQPLRYETAPSTWSRPSGGRRVLVTGGTGFVGRVLVKRLVEQGCRVRVLARKLSNVDEVAALGAEVCWGDVADLESFEQGLAGADAVVHLAAGTSGSEKDAAVGTLQGTKNLLELCSKHRPQRLVYISSCSVYGVADIKKRAAVREDAPLERFPQRRGAYSASKHEAERYVTDYMRDGSVPVVVLRPGTVVGPGGELYTPMLGFSAGRLFVVIGTGGFVLPLVYVDNLVDAIVQSLEHQDAPGQVFNVVDQDRITKRTYMNRVIRRVHPHARVVYLPVLDSLCDDPGPGGRLPPPRAEARAEPLPAHVLAEERPVRQRQDRHEARLATAGPIG